MPTAIVAGVIAGRPGNGGNAWTRLSLALGMQRLGFDVVLVECSDASPEATRFFDSVCDEFKVDGFLFHNTPPAPLADRAQNASVLLNITGHLARDAIGNSRIVWVYIDDDPGYTQLWQSQGVMGGRLARHDFYYTYGQNVGGPAARLPADGINWRPLWPPVVLEQWPVVAADDGHFTTVASWRGGYGRVEDAGRLYGQKAHEFRRFADLPRQVSSQFEIALEIEPADAVDEELMRRHGWHLSDPRALASTPNDFRRFVQRSSAEFSVAQGIYVETNCGWFSDRTTRYLASGKPALIQETGFSDHVPVGEGLVAFSTMDEAVAGVEAIMRDYPAHAQAARAIAEEYFDSDKVLGRMLEEIGL